MKKKGFVSTSLIYTFFIIFLLLMLFLLNSYSRIRFLLEDYKIDIKESFAELNSADINLYFYVWDNKTQEYELVNSMPTFGYSFESEFSYCKNGSTIVYQNGNISVTAKRKDSCYAYFKEMEKDIILYIYTKENKDSERKLVKNIPGANYNFTNYDCTNNATLTFDESTRKFKISSTSKTVCNVEFTKKEMDIILNLYKEDANGTHEYNNTKYTFVNELPGSNYSFDTYKCKNSNTTISIDSNGELAVDATGKDECDLYFVGGTDKVEILIMQETDTGVSGYTTGKKYSRVYSIPGSGYYYIGYLCDSSSASITYSNGVLTGISNTQTTCRAYFNKNSSGKATINYYLETTSGNYESVSSVPEVGYVFDHGSCEKGSTYKVVNNYVEVNSVSNSEVCNFYYNGTSADVKVLVYVMNRETQKYELGNIPVVGYSMYSSGCTNNASIEYINSGLKVTSDGPTVCTVYFR